VGAEHFPEDVVELINYLVPSDGPPTQPAPMPGRGYLPHVWLLGSSTFSAQLAGLLGLPFSFAFHFAPALVDEAVALYRSNFRHTGLLAEPYVMVAASVLCAGTDDEARFLAGPSALAMVHLRTGRPAPVVTPEEAAAYPYTPEERALMESMTAEHVVGDPGTVQRGLATLVERTGADELMLSTRAHDLTTRSRSMTLVAERWGLLADAA
jgi:luciferase family oxidoreductase group 1